MDELQRTQRILDDESRRLTTQMMENSAMQAQLRGELWRRRETCSPAPTATSWPIWKRILSVGVRQRFDT